MPWQEHDTPGERYLVPRAVVDLVFAMRCRLLPADHGYVLLQALSRVLPWLADDETAGVHRIRGAESASPLDRRADARGPALLVPWRAKLVLRLPHARVAAARALSGRELDIEGEKLTVGQARVRPLSTLTTLIAHQVIDPWGADETRFVDGVVDELAGSGIAVTKLVCGRTSRVHTCAGPVVTRSVMVADLGVPQAVRLQETGLGNGRRLGCGIFVPHKGLSATPPAHQ